jgi:hypothetical protein
MKNFKYIFFTALLALCAFSVITYTSCKRDKCKTVACKNGGACNDGDCTCPSGYKGDFCEIPPGFCDLYQCQNGGTCENGGCTCPAGYEGTVCEIETRNKFTGNYICLDKITGAPATFQYTTQILEGDQLNQVKITNFGNGQFTHPVIANVSGNSLVIPYQEPDDNGKSVQATAILSPDGLSIDWIYRIRTASGVTTDYEGVWGKN